MPKFTVTLEERVYYTVEVEAENEDAAGDAARELWEKSQDPFNDFCGNGQGVEIDDVEELDDTWTLADQKLANIEGWGVFDNSDHGTRVERVDDMSIPCPEGDGQPVFVCDADARSFVVNQAESGSDLHKRALARIHKRS